jgi:phage FluMu protein Com
MNRKKPRSNCKHCSRLLERVDQFYCNNQCQHDYKWNKRKESTEKSGVFTSSRGAKRYVIEKFGHKCSLCSLTTWGQNPIPLVIDHIDGNSDNLEIANFRVICPNCDTFTPFYKGRNKGNGRFSRRQRYLNGLSY